MTSQAQAASQSSSGNRLNVSHISVQTSLILCFLFYNFLSDHIFFCSLHLASRFLLSFPLLGQLISLRIMQLQIQSSILYLQIGAHFERFHICTTMRTTYFNIEGMLLWTQHNFSSTHATCYLNYIVYKVDLWWGRSRLELYRQPLEYCSQDLMVSRDDLYFSRSTK